MVDHSDIEAVETTHDHYYFQFRDEEQFAELTEGPDWVQEAAETVADGVSVQMGRLPDSDNLQVASVVVPQKPNLGEEDAKNVAESVVEEIRAG